MNVKIRSVGQLIVVASASHLMLKIFSPKTPTDRKAKVTASRIKICGSKVLRLLGAPLDQ